MLDVDPRSNEDFKKEQQKEVEVKGVKAVGVAPMDAPITQEIFEKMVDDLYNEQENLKLEKANLKLVQAEFDKNKSKILEVLSKLGKTTHKGRICSVTKKTTLSVKVPSEMKEKLKFFDYLKQKKCFEQLVSVNSMTLNAFYKKEMELALEAGNVDFKIPGVEEGAPRETLSIRKN